MCKKSSVHRKSIDSKLSVGIINKFMTLEKCVLSSEFVIVLAEWTSIADDKVAINTMIGGL